MEKATATPLVAVLHGASRSASAMNGRTIRSGLTAPSPRERTTPRVNDDAARAAAASTYAYTSSDMLGSGLRIGGIRDTESRRSRVGRRDGLLGGQWRQVPGDLDVVDDRDDDEGEEEDSVHLSYLKKTIPPRPTTTFPPVTDRQRPASARPLTPGPRTSTPRRPPSRSFPPGANEPPPVFDMDAWRSAMNSPTSAGQSYVHTPINTPRLHSPTEISTLRPPATPQCASLRSSSMASQLSTTSPGTRTVLRYGGDIADVMTPTLSGIDKRRVVPSNHDSRPRTYNLSADDFLDRRLSAPVPSGQLSSAVSQQFRADLAHLAGVNHIESPLPQRTEVPFSADLLSRAAESRARVREILSRSQNHLAPTNYCESPIAHDAGKGVDTQHSGQGVESVDLSTRALQISEADDKDNGFHQDCISEKETSFHHNYVSDKNSGFHRDYICDKGERQKQYRKLTNDIIQQLKHLDHTTGAVYSLILGSTDRRTDLVLSRSVRRDPEYASLANSSRTAFAKVAETRRAQRAAKARMEETDHVQSPTARKMHDRLVDRSTSVPPRHTTWSDSTSSEYPSRRTRNSAGARGTVPELPNHYSALQAFDPTQVPIQLVDQYEEMLRNKLEQLRSARLRTATPK